MTSDALTLFDPAPPTGSARHSDPVTSVAAARKQHGGAEVAIIGVFASRPVGGLTDDEIATRLPDLHPPTVKSARTRLANAGVLADSGFRRPSLRGSPMIAWTLA